MCSGNECCPGFAGSGGKTFPCPSASADFSNCQRATKVTNCVKPPSEECDQGDHVRCPAEGGDGVGCAGNQCCPGFAGSDGKTFPCPSASAGFSNCERPTKVTNCVKSENSLVERVRVSRKGSKCKQGDHVQCPKSGAMCAGNQCCPGRQGTGGTFPCPSASPGFTGCENPTKVEDCLEEETTSQPPATTQISTTTQSQTTTKVDFCEEGESVKCPLSGSMCAGNQCCPGRRGTGGTFPCPSASPSFTGCDSPDKVTDCLEVN